MTFASGNGRLFLGCAHVLAPRGSQSLEDQVFQPALAYSGHRVIGAVRGVEPIEYGAEGFPNLVDAAIVELDDPSSVVPGPREVGKPPRPANTTPTAGDAVRLIGQASDVVHGEIESISSYAALHYPRRAGFQQQILCTQAARPGDSGAVVIDERDRLVGMVIGASDSRTVVTPWRFLRGTFGVRLA